MNRFLLPLSAGVCVLAGSSFLIFLTGGTDNHVCWLLSIVFAICCAWVQYIKSLASASETERFEKTALESLERKQTAYEAIISDVNNKVKEWNESIASVENKLSAVSDNLEELINRQQGELSRAVESVCSRNADVLKEHSEHLKGLYKDFLEAIAQADKRSSFDVEAFKVLLEDIHKR
jgi:septal ring factor EnvC (AmiA/AmiB activator)